MKERKSPHPIKARPFCYLPLTYSRDVPPITVLHAVIEMKIPDNDCITENCKWVM